MSNITSFAGHTDRAVISNWSNVPTSTNQNRPCSSIYKYIHICFEIQFIDINCTLTLVRNTEIMVSSQFILSSDRIVLAFQFGYGDNNTEFGLSPGTISARDAGFPGLIRGIVTKTRVLGEKLVVKPLSKSDFSSCIPEKVIFVFPLFTNNININIYQLNIKVGGRYNH